MSKILFQYEFKIRKSIENIQFLGDIKISDEEVGYIQQELKKYFKEVILNKTKTFDEFEYPLCLCLFLVFKGARCFDEGNFWPPILDDLGIYDSRVTWEAPIGSLFLRKCKEKELFHFEHIGNRYVVSILSHSRVPDSFINQWIQYLDSIFLSRVQEGTIDRNEVEKELSNIRSLAKYEKIALSEKEIESNDTIKTIGEIEIAWKWIELYRETPKYIDLLQDTKVIEVLEFTDEFEFVKKWELATKQLESLQLKYQLVKVLIESAIMGNQERSLKLSKLKEAYTCLIEQKAEFLKKERETVSLVNRVRKTFSPSGLLPLDELKKIASVARDWKKGHSHFPDLTSIMRWEKFAKDFKINRLEDITSMKNEKKEAQTGDLVISKENPRIHFLCEATKCFLAYSGKEATDFIISSIKFIYSLRNSKETERASISAPPDLPERLSKEIEKNINAEERSRTLFQRSSIRQLFPYLLLDLDLEIYIMIPPLKIPKDVRPLELFYLCIREKNEDIVLLDERCQVNELSDFLETEPIRVPINTPSSSYEILLSDEKKNIVKSFQLQTRMSTEHSIWLFDGKGILLPGDSFSDDSIHLLVPYEYEVFPANVVIGKEEWYRAPEFAHITLNLSDQAGFFIRTSNGKTVPIYRKGLFPVLANEPLPGIWIDGDSIYYEPPEILMPSVIGSDESWKMTIFHELDKVKESVEITNMSFPQVCTENFLLSESSKSEFIQNIKPEAFFSIPYGKYIIGVSGSKKISCQRVFWILPKIEIQWEFTKRNLESASVLQLSSPFKMEIDPSSLEKRGFIEMEAKESSIWIVPGNISKFVCIIKFILTEATNFIVPCTFERPIINELIPLQTLDSLNEIDLMIPYDLLSRHFLISHDQSNQYENCTFAKGRLHIDLRLFRDNLRACPEENQTISIFAQSTKKDRELLEQIVICEAITDVQIKIGEDDTDKWYIYCEWNEKERIEEIVLELRLENGDGYSERMEVGQTDCCFVLSRKKETEGSFILEWKNSKRTIRAYQSIYTLNPSAAIALLEGDELEIVRIWDGKEEYQLDNIRYLIRNIRKTNRIEEGDPYEGEVVSSTTKTMTAEGNHFVREEATPVTFFADDFFTSLPFLIDKEKDGVRFYAKEKRLFWDYRLFPVKFDKNEEKDKEVERIYVRIRRRADGTQPG